MVDFKEIKVSFKESNDSPLIIDLPNGKYEITDSFSNTNNQISDNFILNQGDRFTIFKFCWKEKEEESFISVDIDDEKTNEILKKEQIKSYFFRFYLVAEYTRTETMQIEYKMEIKFRL